MKRKLLAIVNFLLIFFIIFSLIFCPHQEQNLVEIPNVPSITQEASQNINGSTGVPVEKIIEKTQKKFLWDLVCIVSLAQ